ncbi:hypothetical protein RB195_012104 [Necator americanus]|uniref:Uncharacterized protein n=1 Tax=Necator americanus TaxID=51031 RepID=A0ABR1D6T6_NECAM
MFACPQYCQRNRCRTCGRPTTDLHRGHRGTADRTVLVCIQNEENGKSGQDDGTSAEMLESLPLSELREMKKIFRTIPINERGEG